MLTAFKFRIFGRKLANSAQVVWIH